MRELPSDRWQIDSARSIYSTNFYSLILFRRGNFAFPEKECAEAVSE